MEEIIKEIRNYSVIIYYSLTFRHTYFIPERASWEEERRLKIVYNIYKKICFIIFRGLLNKKVVFTITDCQFIIPIQNNILKSFLRFKQY